MDGRKRTVQLKFRVTEAERDLILEKMKLIPTRNMAAYLRKIAIDGYIIQIDHSDIKAMTAEIQKIGVNVNQIGGASVYEALLPYCSRILLTETLAELPADRFFPDPSTLSGWKIAKTTEAMQSGGVFFRYVDYVNLAPLTYPQTAAHSEPRSPDAD